MSSLPLDIDVNFSPATVNSSIKPLWRNLIHETFDKVIQDDELSRIKLHYMYEGGHTLTLENTVQTMHVLVNSVRNEGKGKSAVKIETNGLKHYAPTQENSMVCIINEIPVAEFVPNRLELCILFNMFSDFNDEYTSIFKQIVQWLQVEYFAKKQLRNSWMHTENKDALKANLIRSIRSGKERMIQQDEESIRSYESDIRDYTRAIKDRHDKAINKRLTVEVTRNNLSVIDAKVISELDAIVNNPKIKDIHITNGKYTVFTEPIYAYDKNNKRYYIGNCWFTIDIDNTDVRFFNDNTRHGFWGSKDPAPHVDGRSGHACLGNVAATIAQLCSEYELYALALICIGFLEAINIEDVAGERGAKTWDMVDEEGNIITDESRNIQCKCDNCSENIYEGEDTNTVYNDYHEEVDSDGNVSTHVVDEDARTVCNSCREEEYHYNDDAEEYVRD